MGAGVALETGMECLEVGNYTRFQILAESAVYLCPTHFSPPDTPALPACELTEHS